MSRLFNDFIEKVFSGNPHAHDSELAMQVDAEHEEWHAERQKWIDGKITLYNGGTVEQWVALGRPKKQKRKHINNNKMNKDKLNELYKKNGLTADDVFKHKFYTIISRSGIDKIQANNDIVINYELLHNSGDNKCIIIKATAMSGDKIIQTFGESAPNNTSNAYPVAMAEKRAMSRAVLKLTGFYELGHFGEDEADDFKRK